MNKVHTSKPWYVYIIKCSDTTFYTGITTNLAQRLSRHSAGMGAKYTRVRLPVTLQYFEELPDRSSASKREYAIKQLSRAEKAQLITTHTTV